MSQVSRDDHFVPRFYLIGFTDTGKRQGRLYEFDGVTGTKTKGSAKNFGKEQDYHSVNIPGQPADLAEQLFGKIEDKAAPILKEIVKTLVLPSDRGARADFFMFLALSYFRGPQHRNTLMSHYEAVGNMQLRMMVGSPEVWEKTIQWARRRGVELPTGSYQGARDLVEQGKWDVEVANRSEIHTALIVQLLQWMFEMLVKRNWGLEVTNGLTEFFITSDTPASISWTDPIDHYTLGPSGLGYRESDVLFPLHKTVNLVGRYEAVSPKTLASGDRVASVNYVTALFAHRFIYGPTPDFASLTPNGARLSAQDWIAMRRASGSVND